MCVWKRFQPSTTSQRAGHKCVMSAGTLDLCYPSDKENYGLQMQSAAGKDSPGTRRSERCVCESVWLSHHTPACVFMQVFVFVDGVFRDRHVNPCKVGAGIIKPIA